MDELTIELQSAFRSVMAGVASPVSVVTALDGERPHGTTVSAFASLSMTPPMILVSLDRSSDLLGLIRSTRNFGVNVLSSDQAPLAQAFAKKGEAKFMGVRWVTHCDVPRIDGALGWVACRTAKFVDGGDHVLILGEVMSAESSEGPPLTYCFRRFGTHRELRDLC